MIILVGTDAFCNFHIVFSRLSPFVTPLLFFLFFYIIEVIRDLYCEELHFIHPLCCMGADAERFELRF